MNRIILKRTQKDQNVFHIEKENQLIFEHLTNVINIKIGDTLKVSLLDEGLASVKVIAISQSIELHVTSEISPSEIPETHLIVGVSRPPTLKKILEHGSSLGVTHFHFFKAKLSEKSYLQSKVFEHQNLDQLLRLGVSQSSQISFLTEVKLYKNKEDIFDNIPQERYLLSLIGNQSFLDYKDSLSKPIALAIGPERGWVKEEEEHLITANFRPIKISKHTLRVEIATFSALAQLEMFR
jgi:16S rRNA (uracil1498-N3)-methyltransferase